MEGEDSLPYRHDSGVPSAGFDSRSLHTAVLRFPAAAKLPLLRQEQHIVSVADFANAVRKVSAQYPVVTASTRAPCENQTDAVADSDPPLPGAR